MVGIEVSVGEDGGGIISVFSTGSVPRLNNIRAINPPRIITFAPRRVVPLVKKDLIWGRVDSKRLTRSRLVVVVIFIFIKMRK